MHKNKLAFSSISSLLFCTGLFASPLVLSATEDMSADELIMMELQADMQEFTDIATDTKQNVDYMPYVISTLQHEVLSKLGINSLREALKLVPGVDLSVGMAGVKNPIFRGSNPYSFGQSKLIIDGVVVNDQIFGGYNQFLEMPIDLIHRIEVVRGPGSVLSHVNGYAGSIHVITKSNRDDGELPVSEGFSVVGSNQYKMAGAVIGYQQDELRFSTDFYYQAHDLILPSGTDRFMREGELNENLKNYQIGVNGSYQNFSVKGRFSNNNSGVSAGQAFSLTDDESDYLDVHNNSVELQYQIPVTDKVELNFTLGYLDESRELQNKVIPDGASMMMGEPLPNGMYFVVDYKEQTLKQHLEFDIRSFTDHKIVTGFLFSQTDIIKNKSGMSHNDLAMVMESELLSTEGRNYRAFYIDDLIEVSEQVSIQLGAKLEAYSDVDTQFSPRVALVYRHDDQHIFKAMYSHSYREPAWREQYVKASSVFYRSNAELEVELVDAYELAYIHKWVDQSDIKLNIFYLENRGQIQADTGMSLYENKAQNILYGSEVEYSRNVGQKHRLALNYSYVNGDNVGDELANTSSHMAMLYYIHQINQAWSASALYKFVGEKQRIAIDEREVVERYSTVDIATQYNAAETGWSLTAGVKNVFDEDVILPAPVGTYVGDFEQDGRSFFVRVGKEF